ncbi:MAG: response regulator [Acidobacteriota bacterium]
MPQRSLLFIGGDSAAAFSVETAVRKGFDDDLCWVRVDALFDGLRALRERTFDVILSDLFLPDGQGLSVVRNLQRSAPQTAMIALCHSQDRTTGVTAVRGGAYDCFCYEDFDAGNLRQSIEAAMNRGSLKPEKTVSVERREKTRFPCRMTLSYQTLELPDLSGQAAGETVNISSKGLLFTSNAFFHWGQLVEVSLDWPARLENQISLKLVAQGRIVRCVNGRTAMTIDRYEFRTRRVASKRTA